ncbi:MAG: WecB/TagA/CpsF family glycosyltransferase, partial [Candidatus Puniceispirillaceae bacterium]
MLCTRSRHGSPGRTGANSLFFANSSFFARAAICFATKSCSVANKDLDFKQALEKSDILLPDGIGIVWAEKFLNGNRIKKIAGYDLFKFLMNKLNNENGSVFFLGASQETLKKIESK